VARNAVRKSAASMLPALVLRPDRMMRPSAMNAPSSLKLSGSRSAAAWLSDIPPGAAVKVRPFTLGCDENVVLLGGTKVGAF
jgi:hypothetical protein